MSFLNMNDVSNMPPCAKIKIWIKTRMGVAPKLNSSSLLLEEMSGEICLQTVSSIVKMK